MLNSAPAVALGAWSYSLYLWHVPVHYAVMSVFAAGGHPVETLSLVEARWLMLATMLAVVYLSYVSFTHFEVPVRRWLRRAADARRSSVQTGIAAPSPGYESVLGSGRAPRTLPPLEAAPSHIIHPVLGGTLKCRSDRGRRVMSSPLPPRRRVSIIAGEFLIHWMDSFMTNLFRRLPPAMVALAWLIVPAAGHAAACSAGAASLKGWYGVLVSGNTVAASGTTADTKYLAGAVYFDGVSALSGSNMYGAYGVVSTPSPGSYGVNADCTLTLDMTLTPVEGHGEFRRSVHGNCRDDLYLYRCRQDHR